MGYVASTNPDEWDYDPKGPAPRQASDDEATIEIANEFSLVRVRKVRTRNGERLEIHAPRVGHTIHLDAMQLESLSWQDPETFSELLSTPFGPEHE
jgi:hypothetical protein